MMNEKHFNSFLWQHQEMFGRKEYSSEFLDLAEVKVYSQANLQTSFLTKDIYVKRIVKHATEKLYLMQSCLFSLKLVKAGIYSKSYFRISFVGL